MSPDQYLRLTRPFPDAVLFFRLGDCYETYDEDARIAARELAWPLATREFGGDGRVPPVAYHAHTAGHRRLSPGLLGQAGRLSPSLPSQHVISQQTDGDREGGC